MSEHDWRTIFVSVGASVGTAVVFAVFAVVGGFLFQGGMIHQLGGVTGAELDALKAESQALKANIARRMPSNAVIAFAHRDGCVEPWEQYDPATSRVIVGARDKEEFNHVRGNAGTDVVFSEPNSGKPQRDIPYEVKIAGGSGSEHRATIPAEVPLFYCLFRDDNE
jgi:hypothetical protein